MMGLGLGKMACVKCRKLFCLANWLVCGLAQDMYYPTSPLIQAIDSWQTPHIFTH
jgi:hypothetical protein